MTQLGGNTFKCTVPLALMSSVAPSRYFLLEPGPTGPVLSVVCEQEGKAVLEVLKNQPSENSLSTVTMTPPGIVTVTDTKTGRFLYKIRPASKTSIVFGKIDGGEDEVTINDKQIEYRGNVLQSNMFEGHQVGLLINEDGGMGMGAPIPPFLVKLLEKK